MADERSGGGLPLLLVLSPPVDVGELRGADEGAVFYRAQASLTATVFTSGGQDVEFADIGARRHAR